jgi:hypothetical protein
MERIAANGGVGYVSGKTEERVVLRLVRKFGKSLLSASDRHHPSVGFKQPQDERPADAARSARDNHSQSGKIAVHASRDILDNRDSVQRSIV